MNSFKKVEYRLYLRFQAESLLPDGDLSFVLRKATKDNNTHIFAPPCLHTCLLSHSHKEITAQQWYRKKRPELDPVGELGGKHPEPYRVLLRNIPTPLHVIIRLA